MAEVGDRMPQGETAMSEFKDLKMISAADLVKKPDMPIEGKYRTIFDHAVGQSFDSFEKAINIMASRGWILREVIERTSAGSFIYAIFEKKE